MALFKNWHHSKELDDLQDAEMIELIEMLEAITEELRASRDAEASFKALADEQRKIIEALDGRDKDMNIAAKELFS